ncbi:hypothetical protein R3P38DRAFT_2465216, partial [Favolaschia claudopus]
GSDGTRLWNLDTLSQHPRPATKGSRGWTTAMLWIRRADDPAETLFYGTEKGYLVCWKQATPSVSFFVLCPLFLLANLTMPGEIRVWRFVSHSEVTGLCFDPASNRLVVINR